MNKPIEQKKLFDTEPHGAQTLFVVEEDCPLHNQLFSLVNEEGVFIGFTGWELIDLCREFSKYAATQDAMFDFREPAHEVDAVARRVESVLSRDEQPSRKDIEALVEYADSLVEVLAYA